MDKELMGKRIMELLVQNNMTQRQLAERVGATESAISKYVRGDREPRAEVLANIATALHTTSEFLLGKEDGFVMPFGRVKEMCARNAPDMSEDERNELIMAILQASKKD